jgi:hypothetical protein
MSNNFHKQTGDLFRSGYWSADTASPEILKNRAALIRDFAVTSIWSLGGAALLLPHGSVHCPSLGTVYEIDHLETYKCESNEVLLVVSNYNHKAPPWLLMAEYPAVHHPSATTYVRTYRSGEDARQIVKCFDALWWCFGRRPLEHMRRQQDALDGALHDLGFAA